MADRFPLIANSSSNQIQELASGDSLDLTGNNVTGAGIITATTFSGALSGNATGLSGTPELTVSTLSGVAGTFTGNLSVEGQLTYEDVTNVDSIGVITARAGVQVGSGQSFGANGPTAVYYGDGSNLSGISAGISTEASSPTNAVVTLDLSAQDHKLNVTGITTITCSGGTEGDSHTVRIINAGVSTVGFSTYFLFASGATPDLPTASGAISLLSFTVNSVGAGGTQLLTGASLNYS